MGWAVLANQFLAGLHPDLELKGKLAGQEGTFDQLLAIGPVLRRPNCAILVGIMDGEAASGSRSATLALYAGISCQLSRLNVV